MKILVDEMPKKPEECIFSNNVVIAALGETEIKVCIFNGAVCNVKTCTILKEYKPAEDDCK